MTAGESATCRIPVRVTPRGGGDSIDGVREGRLVVRVAAPPADGAANEAVLRVMARAIGLPKGRLRIVSGATSRRKVVVVDGISPTRVATLWPGLEG